MGNLGPKFTDDNLCGEGIIPCLRCTRLLHSAWWTIRSYGLGRSEDADSCLEEVLGLERRRDRREDMLGAGVYTPTPQPPYQGLITELAFVSFEIDPAAVRPFVPPQLAISPSNIVQLAIFECGTAWGLGQHARAVFGLEVEDHDSPDTNRAMFMVAQAISGDAWSIIDGTYGRADRGFARVRREGDTVDATVTGADSAPWLELILRVSGPLMRNNSGIDRYIGEIGRASCRERV